MTILILGASSDVGTSFIQYLDSSSKEDNTVIAHYNKGIDKLDRLSDSLTHTSLIPVQADLSQADNTDKLINRITEISECPDYILFLPAQKFNYMRLKELDIDLIKKEMEISVYSFLKICKTFLPLMKKKSKAGVLTMLTKFVTDELPPRFMTDYIVTKYALLGATKSLKAEYQSGSLNIDYIDPDMMDTAFLDNIDPRIKEINAAKTESGHLLKPEELSPSIYEQLFS